MTENKSINEKIRRKINEVQALNEEIPGVVIIHWLDSGLVEYISERGAKSLGTTQEEIKAMGLDYHKKFFNPEDADYYVPKLLGMIKRNDINEYVTYFQQVRLLPEQDYVWHLSSSKIFMRDEEGNPILSITVSIPVDPDHHVTPKVGKLLEENIFLRKNFSTYSQLSGRERDILKLTALGKSSSEIAEELYIATSTVETHRRNIKAKLNATSSYELAQYARAFDLI
ncbi:helix-turn-helix transcriptional regulator [Pontibacter indicus]|uniref:Regulatory protein, luxR family n=1 Tax=Pontibacter indicus TaxID=1317125 RepID=A0A1R3WXJ4_9BACT|nr:helix-turn-helix transcriptional regulator [Pontibacter indicus]SIT82174.1 regulatory protein, luxR family [Pontibacter indicus]